MELRSTDEYFNKPASIIKLPKYFIQHKYLGCSSQSRKILQYSQDCPGSKSASKNRRKSNLLIKLNNSSSVSFNFNTKDKLILSFASNKIAGNNTGQFRWNNFWLPKITLTSKITQEIEQHFSTEKKEFVGYSKETVLEYQSLKSFLRRKQLIDDENLNIHVYRMLNGRWVTITRDLVVALWDKSNIWNHDDVEVVFTLPLKHIIALGVDPSLSVVYFFTGPECFSKWDITPGEISKTETFISFLIVAALRVRCVAERNEIGMISKSKSLYTSLYHTRFIDVIRMPIFTLPSCKIMNKHICQDKEIVLYTGSAIAKNINGETDFQEEFMMQKGKDRFRPIILSLRGKIMKMKSSVAEGETSESDVLRDINQISSVRRVEDPRPNSILIICDSISIIFSASDSSNANTLYERICYCRRQTFCQSWPAHVILTDNSLFLFSAGVEKELLFRTSVLNMIINLLQHNGTAELLIENETAEAEESLSPEIENSQWSLSFENPLETKLLHRLLFKQSKKRCTFTPKSIIRK